MFIDPALSLPSSDDDCGDLLMAVLFAYFDESGKVADTKSISFCGVLAYEDDWVGISRSWNSALKDADLPYVKMGDAMNWRGPFENWRLSDPTRENLRDTLLTQLVKEAVKRTHSIVTIPYSAADFKALSESEKRRYKDPVYLGFESGMNVLARAAIDHPKNTIHLCCDNSEEYSGQCLSLYQRLRRKNPDLKRKFRALTFAEEADFAGLQLVDIFAYGQREIHTQGEGARAIVKDLNALFTEYKNFSRSFQHEWRNKDLGDAESKEL